MRVLNIVVAFLLSQVVFGQEGNRYIQFTIENVADKTPIPYAQISIDNKHYLLKSQVSKETDGNGKATFNFHDSAVGEEFRVVVSVDGYNDCIKKIILKKEEGYNETLSLKKESKGALHLYGIVLDQDSNVFSKPLSVRLFIKDAYFGYISIEEGPYEFSIPKERVSESSQRNYIEFIRDSVIHRKFIENLVAHKDSAEYRVLDQVLFNPILKPLAIKKIYHIPGIYHLKEGKPIQGYVLNTLFWGGICAAILTGVFASKEIVRMGDATTVQNKWFHEDRVDRLLLGGFSGLGTSLICVGVNYTVQFKKNKTKKKQQDF